MKVSLLMISICSMVCQWICISCEDSKFIAFFGLVCYVDSVITLALTLTLVWVYYSLVVFFMDLIFSVPYFCYAYDSCNNAIIHVFQYGAFYKIRFVHPHTVAICPLPTRPPALTILSLFIHLLFLIYNTTYMRPSLIYLIL